MIQQTNVLADAQNLLKGLLKQIFLVGIWFEGFYSDYLDGDKMNRTGTLILHTGKHNTFYTCHRKHHYSYRGGNAGRITNPAGHNACCV